ncbi:hypothetical protein RhiTH_010964 [Rhizoctonia solani]
MEGLPLLSPSLTPNDFTNLQLIQLYNLPDNLAWEYPDSLLIASALLIWQAAAYGTPATQPSLPPIRPSLPCVPPPAPRPGHLPTLAAPTRQHIPWQPAPGQPLEPAPQSIKESWDPNFHQPPMSNWGKSPSSGLPDSSLASSAKSSTLSGKWKKSEKRGSRPAPTLRTSLKPLQLHGPRTPEDTKPPAVEATPRPIPKVNPIGLTSRVSFWPKPSKGLPIFAQPTPVQAVPPQVPSPPLSLRLRSLIGTAAPPPPAPVAAYPAPVKVDHPDAYTGKIGSEAKQWLTRMLAWTHLNSRMFPTNQEVLSFLLMNMKDTAGAWAHPHLDQLGSHRAIIQTVEGFKLEFLAAFGDPDATRAAEQKITTLTQSGTCADYITKFRTLAMELDWNNAAVLDVYKDVEGAGACGRVTNTKNRLRRRRGTLRRRANYLR